MAAALPNPPEASMPHTARRHRSSLPITFALTALLLLAPAGRAGAAPQAEPIAVRDLLAHAFPTALVAAEDGSAVAWVLNEQGARNIWVAEAPDFTGRRLTSYALDDGQEIGALRFVDPDTLIYVRGGSPNRAGEFPNPATFAAGAGPSTIWSAELGGGEPRQIIVGYDPLVLPGGNAMLYTARGTLMWMPLDAVADTADAANGAEVAVEPRTVLDIRGGVGGVRLSPDGTRIAFSSSRGTHAYVGVVALPQGEPSEQDERMVTWLDPSVDSDGAPVWSPDGTEIAFLRQPAERTVELFAPRRQARPWSIRIASADGGGSRVLFTADAGAGSAFSGVGMAYSPHASGALAWSADGHIAFPWEKNGWRGIYSVPAGGGEPTAVAAGEFEVETAALTDDGRDLLIVSNQEDIDRRHVWRAPIDGGTPAARMTSGSWIEWAPVQVGDGYAWLRSSGTVPAHAVIRPEGAPEAYALASEAIPADYPSDRLVQPQPVMISGADGLPVPAQLFLPADLQPGERRPAAIFFHGGSRRQMLLGFHYSSYYHNAYALSQVFASRGYIALSVNYRSGIGYGMEFREALNYGATGGSEFQDVLGAGLYLRSRDDVDGDRIALWGGSYGGYLTAMGLSRASHLFAAGVDIHGVHDWNEGIRIFYPAYDPTPEQERTAFEASPNASIDTWRSPVLLIHGDDDRNVFFSQSVWLTEQLREREVHVEQLVFPDEVHGFLRHDSWVRAYEATVDFIERMLQ